MINLLSEDDDLQQNRKNKIIVSSIGVGVVLSILIMASLLYVRLSSAWLSDEDNTGVSYSIVKLSMDLSSNHMYTYYGTSNANVDVSQVMTNLQTASEEYSLDHSSTEALEAYATVSKTELKKLYPKDFVDELINLQSDAQYASLSKENVQSAITSYNAAVKHIYKKYSSYINMPFDYRNLDYDKIDTSLGILYHSVQSILTLYSDEYVSQYANGSNNSTIPISVKLKGGTTYSNDTTNEYYDSNFDEMVLPVDMKFTNTGTTNMYLKFRMAKAGADGKITTTNINDNGIIALVQPYDWNTDSDIQALLSEGKFRNLFQIALQGKVSDDKVQTLSYEEMKPLIDEWNVTALETYYESRKSGNNNTYNNIEILSPADANGVNAGLDELDVKLLCFADYETLFTQFNEDNPEFDGTNPEYSPWDTQSKSHYTVYTTDMYMQFRVSLKDLESLDLESDDFNDKLQYNKQAVINKIIGVSNFEVEGNAYFDSNSNGIYEEGVDSLAKNHMSGGYIDVDYKDTNAANYIGKFRLDVRYRGFSPAYIRVRVIEQWSNPAGDIVGVGMIPFTFDSDWKDNRKSDLYLYSNNLYYSTDTDGTIKVNRDDQTQTDSAKLFIAPVITGVNGFIDENGNFFDNTIGTTYKSLNLKLSILIEGVQPNRVEEFWDLGGKTLEQYINDIDANR